MSIVNECMVVNLQIGVWTGHRLDKSATIKVTEDANADTDAARVNKHLIPKAALAPVQTAANALRSHFYARTLPWKDNGDRVLTRKLYQPYMDTHAELLEAFDQAVTTFVDSDYPSAVERAAFRMGSLFDPDDYPRPDVLRGKFYAKLDIDGIAEAQDFRVQLDTAAQERIREGMTQALQERLGKAMQDVWRRLEATLGHFAAKMDSDSIFRDSTVKNLEELVALLPALNITNDPQLEHIRQQIEQHILGVDPKDLRKDTGLRASTATGAKRIMDSMEAYMNAFGSA